MKSKLLLFFLVLNLLFLFFLPVKDTDFGWHNRCGELFLKQGRLCLTNDFSYFLPDFRWANPNFVYDITLAWVFSHFGFLGVSVLGTLIFSAVFLIFFSLLAKTPFWLKTIASFLIIFLSQNVFSLGYRSQILGILFLMLTFLILHKFSKLWFFLPLIFLAWSNSHPSFFLGPLVLSFFLGEKVVKWFINRKDCFYSPLLLIFIFLASIFATSLNPFSWRIYEETINHFQAPLQTMIAEWVAPIDWQIAIIILTTIGTTILSIRYNRADYRFFLLFIFAYFAICARRNLPIYYLLFFYILFDFDNWQKFFSKKVRGMLDFLTVIALFYLMIFYSLPNIYRTIKFDTDYETYCEKGVTRFPCQAIEKLKNKKGHVFNTYEWGGFLIWKIPNMKVFVDGRMSAWKDEKGRYSYQVFLAILQTQPGWNEELERYKTDYLLIAKGTFLDLLLSEDKEKIYGWQEEYRDDLAVIYRSVRKE